MKKFTIFLTGIVLVSVFSVSAQLTVAPKIGINLATMGGDISYNKIRPRIQIGGVINYEIDEMFSAQPGILFTGKGTSLEYPDGDKDAIVLNYVEIPLNGVLNLETEVGIIQFFLGPYIGICVDGTFKYLSDEDNEKEPFLIGTSEEDEFKPLDLGFNIGAGFLHEENVQVQIGYGGSFGDIWNYDDDKLTNGIISLTVAYFFEID